MKFLVPAGKRGYIRSITSGSFPSKSFPIYHFRNYSTIYGASPGSEVKCFRKDETNKRNSSSMVHAVLSSITVIKPK
jgi:hypothetical protein